MKVIEKVIVKTTKIAWVAIFMLSISSIAQAQQVGEQSPANPAAASTTQICTCLEQGKDANCQPIKSDGQSEKKDDEHKK